MFFQQRASADGSLSYFLGCAGQGRAVAVDVVAGDEAWFMAVAAERGVNIEWVIDTHLHADHASGGRALAVQCGACYGLHEAAAGLVHYDFTPLAHGQLLNLGNVSLEVLHTPGHTEESLCLLVTDARRGPEPWFVLTGDTLLVGAVGRPDLAGREREMAAVLFDSLQQQLLVLPEHLEIFPAHQAGSSCGAGLSAKPCSTLGAEKRFNAMLRLDKAVFVEALVSDLPPPPEQMEYFLNINRGLAHAE